MQFALIIMGYNVSEWNRKIVSDSAIHLNDMFVINI